MIGACVTAEKKNARLKIFNTMTRRKQLVVPIESGSVRMYCCGPTVYDYQHIGNMRTYVWQDVLRRTLEFDGYKVKHVRNITDVGHLTSQADSGQDKVEESAKKRHKTAWEISEMFMNIFFDDTETLNILPPHVSPRATQHIKEMLELIKKLEEKGYTYVIEKDGIYYDTSKFKHYGKLTGMSFDELNKYLKGGARVELVPGKKHITDFALWKFSPENVKRDMEWDSPYGKGFPGWHIECSAMSMKYLGESFDIHCGGVDHIPIHHTNEIAQSEGATGKRFAKYWVHGEFLEVDGKKMSKSLGNFYTVDDIIKKGYSWRELRYALMTAHYRSLLNFTFKALDAARGSIERIAEFIRNLSNITEEGPENKGIRKIVDSAFGRFVGAVNDDLNMPKALAELFGMISKINKEIEKGAVKKDDAKYIIDAVLVLDRILGLKLEEFAKQGVVPEEVMKLLEERRKAREERNFELADRIRKRIRDEYGFIIEDTKNGEVIKKA